MKDAVIGSARLLGAEVVKDLCRREEIDHGIWATEGDDGSGSVYIAAREWLDAVSLRPVGVWPATVPIPH